MENNSIKDIQNVYFRCRKEASAYNDKLSSREGASEMLGVSVSSLADYELGNTKVVPVDKVVLMSDLYKAPELLNYYCQKECPIGCRRNFPTSVNEIEKVTLSLINQAEKARDMIMRLSKIAEDGSVNDEERAEMHCIMEFLDKLSYTIAELRLLNDKTGW